MCQGHDLPNPKVVSGLDAHIESLEKITLNSHLSQEVTGIFCYIRRLSLLWDSSTNEKPTANAYGLLEHAENRNARLLLRLETDSETPFRTVVVSFCLATNIYLYAVIREIPLTVPYYTKLVTKLWAAVKEVNFAALGDSFARKLLWILYVGRMASRGRVEQQFFEHKLSDVANYCGLDAGDTRRLVFRQVLWPRKGDGSGKCSSFD